jgi:hypothetical protein
VLRATAEVLGDRVLAHIADPGPEASVIGHARG